jgi:hypothetical protein
VFLQATQEIVEPVIKEQLKDQKLIKDIAFASFGLGKVAPTVEKIYVHHQVSLSDLLAS